MGKSTYWHQFGLISIHLEFVAVCPSVKIFHTRLNRQLSGMEIRRGFGLRYLGIVSILVERTVMLSDRVRHR